MNQETFDNNMKVPSFWKKVTDFRATLTNADALTAWRCKDGSSKKGRVVGRVLSLSEFKTFSTQETNPEYSLFDSAASVHVFHTKERFSNLRTFSRDKGLLCGTSYVPIEGWGDISLPLRVGNQTRLLALKKVAYLSDFLLNLVLLACLEDQSYDWSHRSGKIRNRQSRIVGTTTRNGNNFEIG